jgi:hypothetical protein
MKSISYAQVEYSATHKILLYHFTKEYSKVSYLFSEKQWLRNVIANHDV